jgi:hypothetical protein
MRRFFFSALMAPVPFCQPELSGATVHAHAVSRLKDCKYVYPQHAEAAQRLLDVLRDLSLSQDNPLLEQIASIAAAGGPRAIVLRDAHMMRAVEEVVAKYTTLRDVDVVSVHELKDAVQYTSAFVVGPSRFLPESLFSAPRCRDLHLVCYEWIGDKPIFGPSFVTEADANEEEPCLVGVMPREVTSRRHGIC